jgi:anaerobic nitric oxide reductase flavorubredoxin
MSFKIKDNITWVGKIDWEIRKFHGEEYSSHRGSSYNSYLVQDEKTALIDTVWARFDKEFVENLKTVIPLESIDYVIANHAEPDHSGALPELMKEIPDRPIYCTANGLKSFKGYYHKDWNFQVVKTGDKLNLGSRDLVFVEAAMLHWPDTMFSYLTKDNVLFSNDAFGHHFASELMFNDLVDQAELYQECIKYYANILTPFNMMVDKKIKDVLALGLPVDMICPSHGVIWRCDPLQIVKKYQQWAADYQENQITIVYDSMWEGTRRMAEALSRGITEADGAVAVKLYNISRSDKNDVITEIFRSKALLMGSPTINRGILFAMAGLLEMIKGLGFKKKKAAAFGCYGWSGESVKMITEGLRESGFEVLNDGIRSNWMPGDDMLAQCHAFGRDIAQKTN